MGGGMREEKEDGEKERAKLKDLKKKEMSVIQK